MRTVFAVLLLMSAVGCGHKNTLAPEMSGATLAAPHQTREPLEVKVGLQVEYAPCGAIGPMPEWGARLSDCGEPVASSEEECHACAPKFVPVNSTVTYGVGDPTDSDEAGDPTDVTGALKQGDPTADD